MLINLSNSAYYSSGKLVEFLGSAFERVGLDGLIKMISLISRHQYLKKSLTPYSIFNEDMRLNALCVAHLSEHIAERIGISTGTAYLTGLVYDIRKYPIAWEILGSNLSVQLIPNESFENTLYWEKAVCGVDHIEASVALLLMMNFPENIIESIIDIDDSLQVIGLKISDLKEIVPMPLKRLDSAYLTVNNYLIAA